jgi:hypothetical protein
MNTARAYLAGCGTQTAGLGFGRGYSPIAGTTEEYDGSAWSNSNPLNTGRYVLAGAGIQTAALAFGGTTSSPQLPGNTGATEEYDGSSWANNPTGLNTPRSSIAGLGLQTAALAFGGFVPGPANSTATESYNGSTWTTVNSLNTARNGMTGAGIQTAGLAFGGTTGSVTEGHLVDVQQLKLPTQKNGMVLIGFQRLQWQQQDKV